MEKGGGKQMRTFNWTLQYRVTTFRIVLQDGEEEEDDDEEDGEEEDGPGLSALYNDNIGDDGDDGDFNEEDEVEGEDDDVIDDEEEEENGE